MLSRLDCSTTVVAPDALLAFLRAVPAHIAVLLDEAYFEFMPPTMRGDSIAWVRELPNLVVTRTFSKAYGLAGLRIGYAIAQAGLAEVLRRVRSPFTVIESAQTAAIAALEDADFIERTVELTKRGRARLQSELEAMGHRTLPSHTNFVLVQIEGGGGAFARHMEAQGLIVRPVTAYGLADWVPISIDAEIDRLLATAQTHQPQNA